MSNDLSYYVTKAEFDEFKAKLESLIKNSSNLQSSQEILSSNSDQWFLLINGIIITCMLNLILSF